jgi:hypothetical protein
MKTSKIERFGNSFCAVVIFATMWIALTPLI